MAFPIGSIIDKNQNRGLWVKTIKCFPTQYFKKLVNTDDIREVRITMGNNIFRFLGFFDGQNFIVLKNGFQKKTQRTPKSEIKLSEDIKLSTLKKFARAVGKEISLQVI